MIELRDYQHDMLRAIDGSDEHRVLVQCPTGGGKTVVFAELIRRRGGTALILAHRDELLTQAAAKLRMVAPELAMNIGVVKAGRNRCWTGVLSSERFGVAQTRKRAILLASLDHQPQPPEATHQAYVPGEPAREGEPDLFGPGLRPWRSMAEALGWGTSTTVNTRGDRQTPGGNEFSADRPSWALTEKTRSWVTRADPDDITVEVIRSEGTNGSWPRKGSEPSPTIRAGTKGNGPNLTVSLVANGAPQTLRSGQSVAGVGRAERGTDEPSLSVIGRFDLCSWVTDRPATTVNGDPRISEPGHHDSNVSGSQQANAVRVSVHEAATLQSFPPDWPWWACRSQTAAFTCIGNAIPPLMARRILRAVRGNPTDDRTEPA